MYEEVIRLVSQEEFEKCMKCEHKSLNRKNMYIVYQYIIKQMPKLDSNYKLDSCSHDSYVCFLTKEQRSNLPGYILSCGKYWEFIDLDSFQNIVGYFFKQTQTKKSKGDLNHYIQIILKHLIPTAQKEIDNFYYALQQEVKIYEKKYHIKQEKTISYGVYGIYENDELVYVGMTMRDFEERWEEHKRGIETGSKELIFYSQINKENKIEFKKLIDVSKIKSNSKITKRDVQSMELGLIRVFKPKYNYAGRTVEYKY